jgi:hypothetical protein
MDKKERKNYAISYRILYITCVYFGLILVQYEREKRKNKQDSQNSLTTVISLTFTRSISF